jgi:hypothetical protein
MDTIIIIEAPERGGSGIYSPQGVLLGLVAQRTDYYPSGLPFPNMLNPDEQPFKYNDKEFDTMHGLNQYDYIYEVIFLILNPVAEIITDIIGLIILKKQYGK